MSAGRRSENQHLETTQTKLMLAGISYIFLYYFILFYLTDEGRGQVEGVTVLIIL